MHDQTNPLKLLAAETLIKLLKKPIKLQSEYGNCQKIYVLAYGSGPISGRLESLQHILKTTLFGIKATVTGVAQIMLQQSFVVGLVFVVGAIINSPTLAAYGLFGSAIGVLTAALSGFDHQDNRNGLFGFNGALVGFGLGYYYGSHWLLVIFVLLGAASSTLIMGWMLRKGLRPYTFPFVITIWSIMSLFALTGWFEITPWASPPADGLQVIHSVSRGFGQVIFQENLGTGFLLIAAVFFKSKIEGIYAITASVMGVIIALLLGFPIDAINLGLFGYNGVLCAIALSGKTRVEFYNVLGAIVLSVLFVRCAIVVGIPPLTAPFVFATWLVLWANSFFDKVKSKN